MSLARTTRGQYRNPQAKVFFQTAGIEVSPWLPPLVACAISFFTSMGGVSGAFLLLPFQMSFLGYTHPSVSATNHLFNTLATPSGVWRYWREGRLVWPLTGLIVAGTLPGVFIGAIVRVVYLPNPAHFKLFAAGVLLYIGLRLVRELLRNKRGTASVASEDRFAQRVRDDRRKTGAGTAQPDLRVTRFDLRRLDYTFYGETFGLPTWGLLLLSFVVGIVGGTYGIGGGAIIAPLLVSVFGLPIYTVAGAALMGTFVTSLAAVLFYEGMAPLYPHVSVAPDWVLGALFGLGGMVGMYLGARCQKYVPATLIRWMLAGIVVFTAIKYGAEFIGSL